MKRSIKQIGDRRFFHNFPSIHHRHTMRHFSDHAQIVCDENQRGAKPFAHVAHQVEDLRLNRHIQRCGRFVRDQQIGDTSQRHRDHHALRHPARQFMRKRIRTPLWLGNADQFQKFNSAFTSRFCPKILVNVQHLRDLVTRAEHRVQRRLRLLEDHRDAITSHLHHLLFRRLYQILIIEKNLAFHDPAGRTDQPHNGKRGHTLPTSRFPHNAQHFPRIDLEINPVHRMDNPVFCKKISLQVFDFQQWLLSGHGGSSRIKIGGL